MTRVTSAPVMVGREAELLVLRGALDDARLGRPRAVVVRGDAGMGKTRLVQEALREVPATQPGGVPLVVATGQCVDLGPAGAPFGPLRWLLRDLLTGVGQETFAAAAPTAVLAALWPLLPELGREPAGEAVPAARVNDAVEVVVDALSVRHHVVLVVEDVHWADAATLSLVRSLAKSLRGTHLTLLVTLRSDEVIRSHPLRPAIAELDRGRATTLVDLTPLSDDLVRAQAAAIVPSSLVRSLDSLVHRSGGNPFFVEELLAIGDAPLPETMREVVLARCESIGARARQVLRVLAVGGSTVEHDVLRDVVDLTDVELDVCLREAIDFKVVAAHGSAYRFRHALIQEALYDDLLPGERERLHAQFARALERRTRAGFLAAEAAHHWRRGGEPRRALAAASQALDEAAAAGAHASIPDLTEVCVAMWPFVPDAESAAGRPLWRLLRDAAAVHLEHVTDAARALALARRALELCPQHEPRARAELLWLQRVFQFNSGAPGDPGLLAEADRLLQDASEQEDVLLHARVLGLSLEVRDEIGEDRWRRGRRALTLAEATGDPDTIAYCQTVWGTLLAERCDVPGAVVRFQAAEALARGRHRVAHARQFEIIFLTHLGRYDEAVATGERAVEAVIATGANRGWLGAVTAQLVWTCLCAGQAERAVQLAVRTSFNDLPMRVYVWWMQATHHVWDGRPDLAAQLLDHVRQEPALEAFEAYRWLQLAAELELCRAAAGGPASSQHVKAALTEVDRMPSVPAEFEPMRFEAVPTVARVVGAARRAGLAAGGAEAVLDALLADLPDYSIARAWRAVADAERASDVVAWHAAVGTLDEVRAPAWYLPYALFRLGEALVDGGDRARAGAALTRASDLGRRVGASAVARWSERLAARAGVRTVAAPGPQAVTGVAALTARELQVLELVARGLTNPQIAQRLFISPRTAGVHVAAILRKTGAATRAEAAVIWSTSGTAPEGDDRP